MFRLALDGGASISDGDRGQLIEYIILTVPSRNNMSDSNLVCLVLNTWFESEEL